MNNYPTYKLGEVADYINGRAFKPSEWKENGLPIVRIQNLNDESAVYHYSDAEHEEKYLLHDGDLLFAWAASLGTYIWNGGEAWLNQHIFKVLPKQNVSKMYLYYALTSIIKELYSKSHGSGMVHVTKGKFEETEIPLPPLPTQHAIVTRIETLFTELDKAVQHLHTAQQQIKTYRQAVLNQWLNNEDGKWEMVKLGDVAEMCLGKMLDKNKNKGTFQPYLRNVNVRWGQFDLDDLLEMKFEESEKDKYGIRKGDLIMCEGGEPGRCAIWNSDIQNMKIQKALHRIRLNNNVLNKYVYFLFVLYAQNGVLGKYFTGTTIKHLTGQSLKSVDFPLPPLSEQQRIVAEIESRLSQASAAEESIGKALQQAEALRQSILKKAFNGELI